MTLTFEPFALDLASPLETASGTISQREGFLIRYEKDGVRGIGEATPLSGWTESIEECRAALDRAKQICERSGIDAAIDACPPSRAARHGLSLARVDRSARQAELPLYRHLGGDNRTTVPVNYVIGDGSVTETTNAAQRAREQGYDCLKIKVGKQSVAGDTERIRGVRAAVGPSVELRADANGAWNRSQAARAFEAFAESGVRYVEQPLPPTDIEGHTALAGGPVEVALDETLAEFPRAKRVGAREALRASSSRAKPGDSKSQPAQRSEQERLAKIPLGQVLSADAADVLVLKPMVLGGVDRARRVALEAIEAGVDPVVTTTIDGAYARTGAVHLAASLPDPLFAAGLATGDRLACDLIPDPVPPSDGQVAIPNENGNVPRDANESNA